MNIISHEIGNHRIAELRADRLIIRNTEDGTNLVGDLYFQGFDGVIVFSENICEEFFDLKTKIAGEILQKFSNYKVHISIIGDFKQYDSRSFQDFARESNKGKHVRFVSSLEEALKYWE